MHSEHLDPDVVLFRGEAFESIATAFLHDGDALLVDTLAEESETRAMCRALSERHGVRVVRVIVSHFMADHMGGLRAVPDAEVVAHRFFSHTLHTGTPAGRPDWPVRRPDVVFDDRLSIRFGRHRLDLFHNPGKTLCSIGIEVPTSDLLFTADNVLGRIAYLSGSTPDLVRDGIARLGRASGSRLVEGHQGVFGRESLAWALHYLGALEARVRAVRRADARGARVADIPMEHCLAPGVTGTAFEREWHRQNLRRIDERRLFDLEIDYGPAQHVVDEAGLTGRVRRGVESPAEPTTAA